MHPCIVCFKWRCTLLLSIFISTSLHVSGNFVPIILRTLSMRHWYFSLCMGGCLVCWLRWDVEMKALRSSVHLVGFTWNRLYVNEFGALMEWCWQDTTEVLGEKIFWAWAQTRGLHSEMSASDRLTHCTASLFIILASVLKHITIYIYCIFD